MADTFCGDVGCSCSFVQLVPRLASQPLAFVHNKWVLNESSLSWQCWRRDRRHARWSGEEERCGGPLMRPNAEREREKVVRTLMCEVGWEWLTAE